MSSIPALPWSIENGDTCPPGILPGYEVLRLYLDGDIGELWPCMPRPFAPLPPPPPPPSCTPPPNNDELPKGELDDDAPGCCCCCCIGDVGLPSILLRGGGMMGFRFGTDLPRAQAFSGLVCAFGPSPLAPVCQAAAFGGAIVGGGFDHCWYWFLKIFCDACCC